MEKFPIYTLKKLARKNGIKRISSDALRIAEETLLDLTKKISIKSSVYAEHAGRMTIKKSDVKLAEGE